MYSENYQQPLCLPKGSIRGIIALLTILATLMAYLNSNSNLKELLPLTGTIIGYYFGSRTRT